MHEQTSASGWVRRAAFGIAVALLFGSVTPARAQEAARIAGTVVDESGAPAGYALVALVDADDPAREVVHVLTDDAGRYRIDGVRAGRFRLRVSRIGYEPHASSPVEVVPGARMTRDLVVRAVPVLLDELVVSGGTGCHALDELADAAPDVAALWAEAVKGIEIKQAFLASYRRTVDMRMETHQDNRLIRDVHGDELRTVVFPDTTAAADSAAERTRDDDVDDRYGDRASSSLTLSMPSERVLTDRDMLRGYCVEQALTHSGDGAIGLHFRPLDPDRPGITIEGTVFIEADDYRLRGLSYHYYADDEFVGTGEWVYGNVRVPGDVLRLPVSGSLRMLRIPPPMGLMIRRFDARITLSDYRDFEPLATSFDHAPMPRAEMLDAADAVARAAPEIGLRVWPGFWPADQAFIFYRPADQLVLLVASQVPPPSFEPVPADHAPASLRGRLYVHHGMLPGLESGFNNEFQVGDITAVAVQWTAGESIEEVLATLFHEGFHAHQSDRFDGSSTLYFVRPELIDTPAFRAMAEVERRMLSHALEVPPDRLLELLRRYLAVRRMRLRALPDTVRVRESQVERTEGSAALVGHHASLYAVDELDRMVAVLRDIYFAKPLHELQGGVVEQLMRWRAYGTGAAIGFLLDRLALPQWRERLAAGATFDELLAAAVGFVASDADATAAAALEEFGYSRLLASAPAAAPDAPSIQSLEDFRALAGASVLLELPVPVTNGEADMDLYFSAPGFTQIEDQFLYMPEAESLTLQLPYGSVVVEGRPALLDMRMTTGMVLRIAIGLPHAARVGGDDRPGSAPVRLERLTISQPGVEIRIDRPVLVRVEGSEASVRLVE